MSNRGGPPPWQQGGGAPPRATANDALLQAKQRQDWQDELQQRMARVQIEQAERGIAPDLGQRTRFDAMQFALALGTAMTESGTRYMASAEDLVRSASVIESYLTGPVTNDEEEVAGTPENGIQSTLFTIEPNN